MSTQCRLRASGLQVPKSQINYLYRVRLITGRRPDISMGDWARHGAGEGVPEAVGLRARRRAHLGQDQPAAADHKNR